MSTRLLDVENLGISFFTKAGEQKAVDGISFYVDEGETLGIVGESACGKTVTGLSLLRLLPEPPGKIVSGKIIMAGVDILTLSKKEMREYRGKKKQNGKLWKDPSIESIEYVVRILSMHGGNVNNYKKATFCTLWNNGYKITDCSYEEVLGDAEELLEAYLAELKDATSVEASTIL